MLIEPFNGTAKVRIHEAQAMELRKDSALLLISILVITSSTRLHCEVTDKSHIVFMLVDDWGWANVGYHCDPPIVILQLMKLTLPTLTA